MISARRLYLLSLVSVLFSALVRADDDDDWEEDDDAPSDFAEASGASQEAVKGVSAATHFLQYSDLKIPAGERVEVLVAVSNAPANPAYEVVYVQGSLMAADQSRFVQNFSSQVYSRAVDGSEVATIKYSITPDVQLDPLDYHMSVRVFFKNENNMTFVAEAYNGPVSVTDPLGFDFKAIFTFIVIVGGIVAAVQFFQGQKAAAAGPVKSKKSTSVSREGADWGVNAQHAQYVDEVNKRAASRSASNKQRK